MLPQSKSNTSETTTQYCATLGNLTARAVALRMVRTAQIDRVAADKDYKQSISAMTPGERREFDGYITAAAMEMRS